MIKNLLKTTWRNLLKNKLSSIINIGGLALGVCCFFLLSTYIINELRYDRFHKNADRIAYVSFEYKNPNDSDFTKTANTPTAVVPSFKQAFPEVEDGVRIYQRTGGEQTISVRHQDKLFNEGSFVLADDSFFSIFSFDFISGNPAEALKDPYSLVLTETSAKQYFGDQTALGQSLIIDDEPWKVTGVIKDIPPYSQLQFNLLGAYSTLPRSKQENWGAANDISYLLLKSPNQFDNLQQKIGQLIQDKYAEEIAAGYEVRFPIQKLTDVRLHSDVMPGIKPLYLYVLGTMAIALLLIACINFTNLVMARSAERSHEIGVKKVMGALRKHLFFQFVFESFVTAVLALILGLAVAILLIPFFNTYTGIPLSLESWSGGWFLLTMLVLFIVISLIAGGGPALVLSALKPTDSLKGKIHQTSKAVILRKGLIVFQFCVSLLFVLGTVVVHRQIHYMQDKDTGISRSQVLVLDASDMSSSKLLSFKNALSSQSSIAGVTASYHSPVDVKGGYSLSVDGKAGDFTLSVTGVPIEKDFLSVFDIDLLAGEPFNQGDVDRSQSTDDQEPEYAFAINQTALKALEWSPEEAIGKWVNLNGRRGKIKIITEDFNFSSFHNEIGPIVMFLEYNWFGKMFVKVNTTENMASVIGQIETLWKAHNPNKLFDYHFLDEEFNALYKSEEQTSKILTLFSIATVLVSCLGLFALSSLVIRQRVKEIGVRKVLGASMVSIMKLISASFVKLVIIAIIIAIPLGWWFMSSWLDNFVYRVDVPWWLFTLVALLAIVVAIFTVSFQTIKTALTNPVDSLRDE